jgi:hypothetical protein
MPPLHGLRIGSFTKRKEIPDRFPPSRPCRVLLLGPVILSIAWARLLHRRAWLWTIGSARRRLRRRRLRLLGGNDKCTNTQR